MEISPFDLCYKAQNAFCARHATERETAAASKSGVLIHTSNFFREPKTDEFVQNYILKHFSKNDKVKIVSAGCSSGEEAYSYYMMLDDIKDKLDISGFDLSDKSVEEAKKGIYSLKDYEKRIIERSPKKLTPYERKCREKFHNTFECIDNGLYNKYYYQPHDEYNSSLYKLKKPIPNCNFFKGDVLNLDKMYKEKSVDLLLFRNTLYHLVSEPDYKCMRPRSVQRADSRKTIDLLTQQMGKVVKPKGLVVFGEYEKEQNVDTRYLREAMLKNGFEPLYLYRNAREYEEFYGETYTQNRYTHVYKKVK